MTDFTHAPPPFVNDAGQQVVFVDFLHARYWLEFDAEAREATAFSEITFSADIPGHAAISLNQPITSACLDGRDVTLDDQDSPDAKASFKVLSKPVLPGSHLLTINSGLTDQGPYGFPVTWLPNEPRLHCIFNMSDLVRDGGYLEAFLPSNYCFDQFRMSFSVTIKNSPVPHSVFSNGVVSKLSPVHWKVEFPSFFTSSCPWFHLGPSDEFQTVQDQFPSKDGRRIPILAYTRSSPHAEVLLDSFVQLSKLILHELESDFGSFPHGSLTILAKEEKEDNIAMEYAGAAATDLASLRHELNHSYFARSVIPANGDAGWIDEAIAKWADRGYPRSEVSPDEPINMGRRSPYIRTTSSKAYTAGRDFLAYLDCVLRERGGLKPFLAKYAKRKRHQTVTAVEFQELVEDYYGESLQQLFETHVYSR